MAVVSSASESRLVVRSWLVWASLIFLSNCRFGGGNAEVWLDASLSDNGDSSSGSLSDPVVTRDAELEKPPAVDAADSSEPARGDDVDAASAASAGSGGGVNDAGGADSDAGAGADPGMEPSGSPSASSDCPARAAIASCDPIRNQGCVVELGMQCDIDLAMAKPSGVCVFSAPATDPNSCINIPPVETCPPGHTCVGGQRCQRVCLCDSDCDAGTCCSERIGNSGFKSCQPC